MTANEKEFIMLERTHARPLCGCQSGPIDSLLKTPIECVPQRMR